MADLVRTRVTGIWLILVAATTVSWLLGTDHGLGNQGHRPASTVIFLVALFKVRLVGLYFMGLRDAPPVLRGLFEGYCLAVCALLIGFYWIA
jgi:Prokaryotic Cytochrome C oxidase subunit IV